MSLSKEPDSKSNYRILFVILLFSLLVRLPAFYLPHRSKDEVQYLGLAMKLENFGLKGYNLSGIDAVRNKNGIFDLIPSQNKTEEHLSEKFIVYLLGRFPEFYNRPLFHNPPLFSYTLMALHQLFTVDKPYSAVYANLNLTNPLFLFFRTQFFYVAIPVVFNLLLIIATFFLGKTMFSRNIGIYAAILISVSPVSLLVSQRIWPDGMLSFFITLSLILYYWGRMRNKLAFIFLAGLSCGVSILTKSSGNITLLIVFIHEIWKNRKINKEFIIFFLISIFVAAPWYMMLLKTYGTIFFMPTAYQEELMDISWLKFVNSRPWFAYVVNIPLQTPLFFLAYLSIIKIFIGKYFKKKEKIQLEKNIFLVTWFTAFIICFLAVVPFGLGKELRYILPAYPAIAILSAEYIESIRVHLANKFSRITTFILMIILFIISSSWSLAVGLDNIFKNFAVIKMPL